MYVLLYASAGPHLPPRRHLAANSQFTIYNLADVRRPLFRYSVIRLGFCLGTPNTVV